MEVSHVTCETGTDGFAEACGETAHATAHEPLPVALRRRTATVSPTLDRRFNSCDWSPNRRSRANLDRTRTVQLTAHGLLTPYAGLRGVPLCILVARGRPDTAAPARSERMDRGSRRVAAALSQTQERDGLRSASADARSSSISSVSLLTATRPRSQRAVACLSDPQRGRRTGSR
jgi:hypothetical protein